MKKRPDNQRTEEFNAFEKLTKSLLAVPKKEVDQKREEYESAKKREGERKK